MSRHSWSTDLKMILRIKICRKSRIKFFHESLRVRENWFWKFINYTWIWLVLHRTDANNNNRHKNILCAKPNKKCRIKFFRLRSRLNSLSEIALNTSEFDKFSNSIFSKVKLYSLLFRLIFTHRIKSRRPPCIFAKSIGLYINSNMMKVW